AALRPPDDWPWPSGRSPSIAPALWLRYDGSPAGLPLRASVQPRTVHHETTVTAQVERRWVDVLQETVCHVHYGTLTRLDVSVPRSVSGIWDLEGDAVATRQPLKLDPDGRQRYRLTLSREVAGTLRLRFRFRIPLEGALAPGRPTRLEIPWLRVLEGSTSPPQVKVAADIEIDLEPEGRGWVRAQGDEPPAGTPDGGPPVRFTRIGSEAGDGPAVVIAEARALMPLPHLVASRLWLRTIEGPEGELR